jgi:predicted RNA methylase
MIENKHSLKEERIITSNAATLLLVIWHHVTLLVRLRTIDAGCGIGPMKNAVCLDATKPLQNKGEAISQIRQSILLCI